MNFVNSCCFSNSRSPATWLSETQWLVWSWTWRHPLLHWEVSLPKLKENLDKVVNLPLNSMETNCWTWMENTAEKTPKLAWPSTNHSQCISPLVDPGKMSIFMPIGTGMFSQVFEQFLLINIDFEHKTDWRYWIRDLFNKYFLLESDWLH